MSCVKPHKPHYGSIFHVKNQVSRSTPQIYPDAFTRFDLVFAASRWRTNLHQPRYTMMQRAQDADWANPAAALRTIVVYR
jgi:hypothetical protein